MLEFCLIQDVISVENHFNLLNIKMLHGAQGLLLTSWPHDSHTYSSSVMYYLLSSSVVCLLCAGKQVIHPGQIQAVQEEFSPSLEKVQWAKELISAFDQHQKEGKVMVTSSAKNHYILK